MLTDGVHHVAILTEDTGRFTAFYQDVFDATIDASDSDGPVRLTFVVARRLPRARSVPGSHPGQRQSSSPQPPSSSPTIIAAATTSLQPSPCERLS